MILVTGSNGQVGYELLRTLAPYGQVKGLTRGDGDLSDPLVVNQLLSKYRPTCIVNAAAYTAVDQAESNQKAATALNTDLPGLLANWATAHGTLLIHYSTDYVYDGAGGDAWKETDPTEPLSIYGKTKLAGDKAVLVACNDAIIFRTSWVYGARGRNFMLTMLKLASEREKLNVVADQWGAPTPAWLIAQITAEAVGERLRNHGDLSGLYHLTCRGKTSWYEFAKSIIARAVSLRAPLRMTEKAVFPISSSEYTSVAPRPANSRLDVSHLEASLKLTMPDWETALDLTMRDWAEYTHLPV